MDDMSILDDIPKRDTLVARLQAVQVELDAIRDEANARYKEEQKAGQIYWQGEMGNVLYGLQEVSSGIYGIKFAVGRLVKGFEIYDASQIDETPL